MARPLRLEIANGIYHVVARGNERGSIFCDDTDRSRFCELLAEVRERYQWRILSYCLMGNHYHLLAQTPSPNLARGMRQLNGVYAQRFNRRHARVGHLLQGRYRACLVQEDGHLLSVVRYIVRNPVQASLCESPSDWRFSSHRAALGRTPPWFLDTAGLLSHYGPTRVLARERYREHTEAPGEEPVPAHPLVLGDDSFVGARLAGIEARPGIPGRYYRRPRPPLGEILTESGDPHSLVRAHAHGYSLREIASQLGCNASTVSRRLQRLRDTERTATDET